MPGLAMVSLRKISLQRRRGNFTEAGTLYKDYIENAETTEVRSFYAIKYARYLCKVRTEEAQLNMSNRTYLMNIHWSKTQIKYESIAGL